MNVQGVTPNVAAPVQAQSASGSTGMLGGSSANLQDTFLSLLVTELQNQDPTSPVDPQQMVGQMVSLNQLDQLIAMNKTLSGMAGGLTSAASGTTPTAQMAAGSTGSAATATAKMATASTSAQVQPAYAPVDPNAMLNLYGSVPAVGSNSTFVTSGGK